VRLVLEKMAEVPDGRRAARFVAAIALSRPGSAPIVVQERVEGTLTGEPQGEGGFGYDPIFYFPPLGRTFAELEPEEKDRVSHRGKALRRMAEILAELL
jgi:XTP/dITP diphosphohydrolase